MKQKHLEKEQKNNYSLVIYEKFNRIKTKQSL